MDVVLGFVTGIYLSAWFIGGILCFAFLASQDDRDGWSTLWMIIAGSAIYINSEQFLELSTIEVIIMLGVYALAGFFWSIIRWKRYVNSAIENFKANSNSEFGDYRYESGEADQDRDRRAQLLENRKIVLARTISPSEHMDDYVFWIVNWPMSTLANLLGDVYVLIKSFISSYLSGIYKKITDDAMEKINENK